MTALHTSSEYARSPGVVLHGKCSVCKAKLVFVVSPAKYDELARARKVRDERGKPSKPSA